MLDLRRLQAACGVILVLAIVAATTSLAQGVYRVLFADLAVLDVKPDLPTGAKATHYTGTVGGEFSLEIVIDNLGDLPVRDTTGKLRVFMFPGKSGTESDWEISP